MIKIKNKGFTLVELLVVILIIGILATVGLTMYSGVQKSARIAKRIEDLRAIKNALEVYNSVEKSYPSTFVVGATPAFNSSCSPPATGVVPNFVPKYMSSFPKDPLSGGCYRYASNGVDYKLYNTNSEMASDFQSQSALIDPARDGSTVDNCRVDTPTGGTVSAWAIWSSCDPAKCAESGCSW